MPTAKRSCAHIAAFVLAATLGCASTSHKEGAGEYVDNSVITTKVEAAIFNEPSLKVAEINVDSFKGVVQRSDVVDTRTDMDKVVEIARGVAGVKSVTNDPQLK